MDLVQIVKGTTPSLNHVIVITTITTVTAISTTTATVAVMIVTVTATTAVEALAPLNARQVSHIMNSQTCAKETSGHILATLVEVPLLEA